MLNSDCDDGDEDDDECELKLLDALLIELTLLDELKLLDELSSEISL